MPKSKAAVDRQGYPIDLQRPIVVDDEGVHTEVSITEKIGDRYVNLPSIWNGRRYDPAKDEDYAEIMRNYEAHKAKGWKFPEFDTPEKAVEAAKDRSDYIGKLRAKELREAEERLWKEEAAKREP